MTQLYFIHYDKNNDLHYYLFIFSHSSHFSRQQIQNPKSVFVIFLKTFDYCSNLLEQGVFLVSFPLRKWKLLWPFLQYFTRYVKNNIKITALRIANGVQTCPWNDTLAPELILIQFLKTLLITDIVLKSPGSSLEYGHFNSWQN